MFKLVSEERQRKSAIAMLLVIVMLYINVHKCDSTMNKITDDNLTCSVFSKTS